MVDSFLQETQSFSVLKFMTFYPIQLSTYEVNVYIYSANEPNPCHSIITNGKKASCSDLLKHFLSKIGNENSY